MLAIWGHLVFVVEFIANGVPSLVVLFVFSIIIILSFTMVFLTKDALRNQYKCRRLVLVLYYVVAPFFGIWFALGLSYSPFGVHSISGMTILFLILYQILAIKYFIRGLEPILRLKLLFWPIFLAVFSWSLGFLIFLAHEGMWIPVTFLSIILSITLYFFLYLKRGWRFYTKYFLPISALITVGIPSVYVLHIIATIGFDQVHSAFVFYLPLLFILYPFARLVEGIMDNPEEVSIQG